MATGGIVASNALISSLTTTLQTVLNTGHTLRLFQNNFTPTPASILSNFTEANFAGYASQSLTSQFATPTKIMDGEYQTASPTFTFTASPGASSQTIYGFYIDDGTNVKLSQAFGTPLAVGPSSSFTVQINAQGWSLSIVP